MDPRMGLVHGGSMNMNASITPPPPPPPPPLPPAQHGTSVPVSSVPVSPVAGRPVLGRLAGVNRGDDMVRARESAAAAKLRSRPRVLLSPVHAVTVILLLVAALALSLTLLAQQAVSSAAVDGETTAAAVSDHPAPQQAGEPSASASASLSTSVPVPTSVPSSTPQSDAPAAPTPSQPAVSPVSPQVSPPVASQAPAPVEDGRVDLNTASAAELDAVKGIGPAIAQRIIDHRRKIGRFTSVDQLLDVPGIGVRTLEKMRGELVVR